MAIGGKEKFETVNSTVSKLGEASTQLEKFATSVLQKLIEDNVPPIPYYYNIYFSNALEEESYEFKKQILEMTELEETNEAETSLQFEKNLKLSASLSKEILKHSAMSFKISSKLKEISTKNLKELQNSPSLQNAKNIVNKLSNQIEKLNQTLEKEMLEIKKLYSKNVATLKEMEKDSIFDGQYGIFNKNSFIKQLQKELKLIEKFKHISSIILVRISKSTLDTLNSSKSKILLNRTVSKIMLKTSRRTDIVAHLGDGVFGMILKHTDRIGAMKTSERLSDTIASSAVFLEDKEIEIKIHIGIVELVNQNDFVKIIDCAMNSLANAETEGTLYKICEEG